MRVIVALVVVSISFSLGGCSRPPQAEHPKLVRSKWVLPQSQRHVPKFTEVSAAKTVTKASRPVSKRSKKFKTHLAKPARRQIEAPASADRGALLPPRKPEVAPATDAKSSLSLPPRKPEVAPATDAKSPPSLPPRKPEVAPATDAESSPSLPPRKPEQSLDSREHAVPEAKFMAAKEKARREGVHSLTSEDVRGLSQGQIKELRGY
jgi:hypothetical protein